MHATGRAFVRYSPFTPYTIVDYWTWRRSSTKRHAETDEPCIEIVRGGIVVVCSHTSAGIGGRLANALNRAYGLDGAPRYDERTGDVIEQ